MATLPIHLPPPVDEALTASLSVSKLQTSSMRKYLEADQLMDALKAASTMLAELRTSSLSPKQYYELYMAVFDALRYLSNYLYEAHTTGKHHLADLYELVQYAGNIVPRLYLMITVGSVYMSIPDAPIKEIMKDMMEMSRGVQHPTRGLFLRHYLSGQTRDHLPIGEEQGPQGNLQDSIAFVVTNFVEMNKLWVRLQHQGHSRDKEKRELERKELRILVGTNLVRLSQLEGVDLVMYQSTILPGILEQVVNCKDVIAQEYLMEVIIQVFTDEFHLHTLAPFLSATAQLHPKVNIKQIVIALIDRLAAYAAREAENEDPEETKRQEEAAARRLAERVQQQRERLRERERQRLHGSTSSVDGVWADSPASPTSPVAETHPPDASAYGSSNLDPSSTEEGRGKVKKFRGIPEDVRLFEVFWYQVVELIKARPDLSIQDITALLVSLANLCLSCYPDRLEYVDQVLGFAREKMGDFADSPDLHITATTSNILSLLLAPINSYQSALTLLAIPNYSPLLVQQTFATRRSIATSIVSSILKNETYLETPEDVSGILDVCHVLIRDQTDTGVGMGSTGPSGGRGIRIDPEDVAEEQGWVARMVHLLRSDDLEVQHELLQTARRYFAEGGDRMRYTYPPLITAFINLARRYKPREFEEVDWPSKVTTLLRSIHQLISVLNTKVDSPSISLRLFLLAAQVSDLCGFEELAYEFYVQAFSVYEESISDSRAQLQAIITIIGTLQGASVFGSDNYDTLSTKAALHAAKLLKKPHQSIAVQLASHLWWQTQTPQQLSADSPPPSADDNKDETSQDKQPMEDGKRVLECLQRSLRVAGASFEEIISLQLYCDALDRYLYYFDRDIEEVTSKYVNTIIELIVNQIDIASSPDLHPTARAPPGLIEGVQAPEMIIRHFRNTLDYIRSRRSEPQDRTKWSAIDIVGALVKMGMTS
ncbi:vacuolar protein sorting-associated protein 35 [Cantharellus anzutake]|uniref:vacuolar protein sorting-associated protein 35 n=1 Tax=Cantharellus anzutake TaxID=1750568 RepID=UPI001904F9EF|nr:vacuolar protein sorting-associated protein 35 [Cantharellus anzutake]KAF8330446.1 vacuolar protein sorting-associated protein 35 [Cantharellus anzutake]